MSIESTAEVVALERVRRQNLTTYGTVTRYRALTSDGIAREVIHGQALARHKPAGRSVDLTVGTAPPLSLGPEGLTMHFLLKSMEFGLDGIVFGPEGAQDDPHIDAGGLQALAMTVSLPRSADAAHRIADRLQELTGTNLSTMLWTGISLGALKGIGFAAAAPSYGRVLAYSHFVAPVCPDPVPLPTKRDLRRFTRGEFGAMLRLSTELMWKDTIDRTFKVHQNVARVVQPGLVRRYARAAPRDSASRVFTDEWRRVVVSGEGGIAAAALPLDRLATFELFDHDEGSPIDGWKGKLSRQLEAGTTHIVVKKGRHTDATRLGFQRGRAQAIRGVVKAIYAGTPVEALTHPLA